MSRLPTINFPSFLVLIIVFASSIHSFQVGNWKTTTTTTTKTTTKTTDRIQKYYNHHVMPLEMNVNGDDTTSTSTSSSTSTTSTTDPDNNPIVILNGDVHAQSRSSLESTSTSMSSTPAQVEVVDTSTAVALPWKRRIFEVLKGKKKSKTSNISFREQLAKAGLAVVLSYGAVSNASYGVCISIAWYGFSKKVGRSIS
jgi:hypothetical protein